MKYLEQNLKLLKKLFLDYEANRSCGGEAFIFILLLYLPAFGVMAINFYRRHTFLW